MTEWINELYEQIHNFAHEEIESVIERYNLASDPEALHDLCFVGSIASDLLIMRGISWIKLTCCAIDGKITKKRLKGMPYADKTEQVL